AGQRGALPSAVEPCGQAVDLLEGDAHRRPVRAGFHAGRPPPAPVAEVALAPHLHGGAVGGRGHGGDHHDVARGTALRAVRAADAARLVDAGHQRADLARDGARGAVQHADGVRALVAGGGDLPALVLLTLAHEAREAAVALRAPADA